MDRFHSKKLSPPSPSRPVAPDTNLFEGNVLKRASVSVTAMSPFDRHSESKLDNCSVNHDWDTTCAIYCDNETIQSKKSIGIIDITISTTNVIFARRISPFDDFKEPAFQYWHLTNDESPIVRLRFHYDRKHRQSGSNIDQDNNALGPSDVHVSFCHFPADDTDAFPRGIKQEYLSWLTDRANEVLLQNHTSYAVCEFIEHDSLQFFNVDHVDECHGFTMLMLPARVLEGIIYKGAVRGDIVWPLGKDELEFRKKQNNKEGGIIRNISLDTYAKLTIMERWRTQFEMECPICFDTVQLSAGVMVPCGHLFCEDCLKMYVHMKVEDLKEHRTNPFKCPVTSCRRDMPVVGFVKKHLSEEDMNKVRGWYKDLKTPPCWSLTQCMSQRCGKEGTMRRPTAEISSRNHYVFCEECTVTWCELCLKKVGYNTAAIGKFDHEQLEQHYEACDPSQAIQFCQRYLSADDMIKRKCEKRFPWIKIYANSHAHDAVSMKWILENGQVCPTCKTGVERIEGCFHMKCSCGTHFCYECGDELYPPYYGTHHCWEVAATTLEL